MAAFHCAISHRGFAFATCTSFQNNVINMYIKCGSLRDARKVFDNIKTPDDYSWNAIIAAYRRYGFPCDALALFHQMQLSDVQLDEFTFSSILPACAKTRNLEQGMEIHQSIMENDFFSDIVVANALLDMYAKCGEIHKARRLFDEMTQKNVVSWNAMISGYAQNGFSDEALRLFESNPSPDVISWNALIDVYAKCGRMQEACQLFEKMPQRDVVSWNAMIAGYAQSGFVEKALETFKEMQSTAVKPDSITFSSILPACAKMGALEQGMDIHQSIIESGVLSDVVVVSALVDMYAKCGSILKANELFEKMHQRDVISWNAMISGYTLSGFIEKALEIFKQMGLGSVKPDSTTFASILPACAKMGALEHGMNIHQRIVKNGNFSDVTVVNALIDMYAKCGSIQKARELFDKLPQRDVISWNAMIAGYAQNGFCKDALKLFEQLKTSKSQTLLNHISFACVLFACSHAGLVDEGCKYFNCMNDFYCIVPTIHHYVCMVDLLCRAGYLEETLNFIIKIPVKPMSVVWTSLLGACGLHKNMGLGVFAATLLLELDPVNAATYILLSKIYAEVGCWGEIQMVKRLMKDGRINKRPGCSWIEDHKMVHVFCAGDKSHPQTQEIYAKLENLSLEMKAAGYVPDSRHVLNDVEKEEKDLFLCQHSEKLAIAFGLLNTPPGTTVRVFKNLRVCIDCHSATKFISKIVSRDIVVRDANWFHHFKQGHCSCRDYW